MFRWLRQLLHDFRAPMTQAQAIAALRRLLDDDPDWQDRHARLEAAKR
jgi:hypothetical protein